MATQVPGVLANAQSEYRDYTTLSSTVARSLNLAAVAIIWLYAGGASSNVTFGKTIAEIANHFLLITALIAAIVSLALDLLQYLVASVLWAAWRETLMSVLEFDDFASATAPSERVSRAWGTRYGRAYAKSIAESPAGRRLSTAGATDAETARQCLQELATLRSAQTAQTSSADVGRREELQATFDQAWSPPGLEGPVSLLYYGKLLLVLVVYCCLIIKIALAV